jgi:hypothetical protein
MNPHKSLDAEEIEPERFYLMVPQQLNDLSIQIETTRFWSDIFVLLGCNLDRP